MHLFRAEILITFLVKWPILSLTLWCPKSSLGNPRTLGEKFIAVVSVQTILSPEPDESLIVLYDLSNLGLGESLSSRKSREPDIVPIDYGDSHGARAATTHF